MSSIRITLADRDEHGRILMPSELRARDAARHAAATAPAAPLLVDTAAREVTPEQRHPLAPPAQSLARARGTTRETVLIIGGALLLAGLFVALSIALSAAPVVRAPATPALAVAPSLALPTLAPRSTSSPAPTLGRALVAYSSPAGAVQGALDSTRAYSATARYGAAWIQLVTNGAPVWVRAGDLPTQSLAGLPDLAPPPTATPTPTNTPLPTPVPPTADIRPVACVTTLDGQYCERGLDPHDAEVATMLAQTSAAYNAPYQQAANATATAFAQRTPTRTR